MNKKLRSRKMLLLPAFLTLFTLMLNANTPVNLRQIIRQFGLNQKLRGQEKIYLHTDKEMYLSGENIWYKAYLLDAVKHLPSDKSHFLYTELIDEQDNIVQRQKLHKDSVGYYGNLSLPKNLPSGRYRIRAYTIWMENAPEDYFFRKIVTVHNPYASEDSAKQVSPAKPASTSSPLTSAGSTPALKSTPDLQFFPEGGHLIVGRGNTIGFKAIGSNGLSVDISGTISDDTGTKICTFQSALKGMGRFLLTAEPGRRYYANIKGENGKNIRIMLPEATSNAVTLRTRPLTDRLIYYIDKGDETPASQMRYLVIHQRGKLLRIEEIKKLPQLDTLKFEGLSDGIAHILITDSLGNPLSERLSFISNPENKEQVKVALKRSTETQNLSFQCTTNNIHGNAVPGNYSLSVSNANRSLGNRTHIKSNLLLTSDLKGYIEDPEIYFLDSLNNKSMLLDNLLLTQGWTRFDAPALIQGAAVTTGKHPVEKGQILSGIVRDKKKNLPVNGALVSIMGMKSRILETPETDQNGRFYVESISFSDSTHFIFRAGEKMKSNYYIEVDQDTFPAVGIGLPPTHNETSSFQAGKEPSVDTKMRQINLKQVDVRSTRYQKPKSKSYFHGVSDYTANQSRLKDYPQLSLQEVLPLLFPFIEYEPMKPVDAPTIRNVLTNEFVTPALMVNERYFDWEDYSIYGYKTDDIESIDIIRGIVAEQLSQNSAIVVVRLKEGARSQIKSNVQLVDLLGWHKPVNFYRPRYEFQEERNALSPYATVFWTPSVAIDASGKVEIPTKIKTTQPLRVVLEGVSAKGEIIHYQGDLK